MEMTPGQFAGNNQILKYLKSLEARISRIEAHLKLQPAQVKEEEGVELKLPSFSSLSSGDSLEFHIGQFWFAKVGIVVLAFGLVFLLTFPYQNLPVFFPSLIGYFITAGLFIFGHLWKESFVLVSRYLVGSALLLLYFSTLRLHYFSAEQTVSLHSLEIALLIGAVIIQFVVSLRRKSIYLSTMSLAAGYLTAVLAGNAYVIFVLNTILAFLVVFITLKYQWMPFFITGIIFTYLVHLIWAINNPVLGNQLHLVSSHPWNLLFLMIYNIIFAGGILFRNKEIPENNPMIAAAFFNCLGAYGLFLVLTVSKFRQDLGLLHLLISAVFILMAIIFWVREHSKYSTFFYAMFGYSALSVAIIAQFASPDFYIWLCWQSLLVIVTAIWFRSKIIVVANFIIYLLIFISYLIIAGRVSIVSLSFGIVALLSARIMNWKKHRLDLKTELMRNAFLATAFFIIPYSLYHAVPSRMVILAWAAVALTYYLISILLNNKKYRWMALFTMLLTAAYLLVIGVARLEPMFRIISLLAVGILLLIISLLYTKYRSKSSPEQAVK
ncbi:MAG: hypothetical protein WAN36_13665 [Calditrichia bacterium]